MSKKRALKVMRRLFPAVAGRDVYARRTMGACEVGLEIHNGKSYGVRNERIALGTGPSWEAALVIARRRAR